MEELKHFKVKAKCGHVGRRHYVPIYFPVQATTKKEAAKLVKTFPRVKRNHPDAILEVEEITAKEYKALKIENDNNPYLKCKSKYQQRKLKEIKDIMVPETKKIEKIDKKARQERVEKKQKKNKEIEKSHDKELGKYK